MKEEIQKSLDWFQNPKVLPFSQAAGEEICPTRDVFQGRLDSMLRDLSRKKLNGAALFLFTAILGELGNNCFDHNLGQWRDITGCRFQHGFQEHYLWGIIADRGQGVCSSLRRVLPNIQDDGEALEIAFHKKLSGRSPEKRGNGLKFVRSVINGNEKRGLFFVSGNASRIFGDLQNNMEQLASKKSTGQGTFAVVLFEVQP